MSGEARYSQPLASTPRANSGQVVYAGFTRSGEVGFIVREKNRKPIHETADSTNAANEHPRGFLSSLARLMFGGPR
jgi:hypothetical protein